MQSPKGTILDAAALIDFRCLDEWDWLTQNYDPLFIAQEVLESNFLETPTRQVAQQYLKPLALDTDEMFACFSDLNMSYPLLSIADRSTISIARHQCLICLSGDTVLIEVCQDYDISYIHTSTLESKFSTCSQT